MKRWKVAVLVIGVLSALAPAALFWIDAVAARRWAETLRRTTEIAAELGSPIERIPLRGEALPGNAWADYHKALVMALVVAEKEADAVKAFDDAHAHPNQHSLPHAANPMREVIETARMGTRRSTSTPMSAPPILEALLDCWYSEAHCLAASGKRTEAIELMADLVRLGHEKATLMYGITNLTQATGDLRTACELIAQAGPSELSPTLGSQFERLEMSIPSPARHDLHERANLVRVAEFDGFSEARAIGGLSWRNAWSVRLIVARTSDTLELRARELESFRNRSRDEVYQIDSRLLEEVETTGNELLLKYSDVQYLNAAWTHLAHLRLARAAAHFRATGERLEIEDPFGGKLTWGEEGVRSRGETDDPKDDIILRLKP